LFIRRDFALGAFAQGAAVSSILVGAMIGALVSGLTALGDAAPYIVKAQQHPRDQNTLFVQMNVDAVAVLRRNTRVFRRYFLSNNPRFERLSLNTSPFVPGDGGLRTLVS
jgi:hypothetical protein